jgi:hypothetical protein
MRSKGRRLPWGFAIFCLATAFGFYRLALETEPGHFRVFISAGRALLSGTPAYGTDFGTGVGEYFYSPLSALLVFAPLSFLPLKLGLFLYAAVSWIIFVLGARRALGALARAGEGLPESENLFFALMAPPMLSSLMATKLEIVATGLLLIALSDLLSKRESWRAGALSAFVTSWKFQPLPIVLLWLVVLKPRSEIRRFLKGFVPALLVSYALPYVFIHWDYLNTMHVLWMSSLASFTQAAWLDFENLFSFLKHALGIELSWAQARVLSAFGAIGALATVRSRALGKARPADLLLFASGLGTAYVILFSPLGQNNALVIVAPLLLWAVHADIGPQNRRLLMTFLALSLTLPYSDLVPLDWRNQAHAWAVKPILLGLSAIYIASIETWRGGGRSGKNR